MKAKVIREGFIDGRLVRPDEIIEVNKPGSWYVPLTETKPAKGGKSEADKGGKSEADKSEADKGAADAAAALT